MGVTVGTGLMVRVYVTGLPGQVVAPLEALGVTVTVEVIGTVPAIEALNPGMGVPVPEVGVRPTFVLMLHV